MCVMPQGTMKQPELPGEMQTTYIILEAPLDAKIVVETWMNCWHIIHAFARPASSVKG